MRLNTTFRNVKKYCGLFIFALLVPFCLFVRVNAETIECTHISLDKGLSQISIHAIIQDHRGFMWFGTDNGVNKYDGYHFTVYEPEPGNKHSLSDGTILSLCMDSDGNLWIGTRSSGLDHFYPRENRFENFRRDPENPLSLSDNELLCIYENPFVKDNILWIGTSKGGLNKFDRNTGTCRHFKTDKENSNSICSNMVTTICAEPGKAGKILHIGTDRGIIRFDTEKEEFFHHISETLPSQHLSHPSVKVLLFESPDTLWIGTWGGGLNRLNLNSGKIRHFKKKINTANSINDNFVQALVKDSRGKLWVGTENGITTLIPDTGTFTHHVHDPLNPRSLSGNRIVSLFEDRSGVMWAGTWVAGVNKFDGKKNPFVNHTHIPGNPNSLIAKVVINIFEDSNNMLWIGTTEGLERYNREAKKHTHFRHDPSNNRSISFDYIRDIFENHTKELWIATRRGLNRFDRKTQQFTRYVNDPEDPESLSSNALLRILEAPRDNGNYLWIGTREGGLNRFHIKTGKCKRYMHDPENESSISSNKVYDLYMQKNGVFWLGTWSGINRFDIEKEKFYRYLHDPNDPGSISSNRVTCVVGDLPGEKNLLWIAT
ncbi:MAG: histidine kinase, partial [bacterium]|nr:histidine kinase [bacterium]